jgi:hypothetical protein
MATWYKRFPLPNPQSLDFLHISLPSPLCYNPGKLHCFPQEQVLSAERLGEILALVGLGLLVLSTMGRRRVRQRRQLPTGAFGLWVRWGDFAAFGFLLAGLVLMYAGK